MTQPAVAADPFLFDAEQLTDLASPRIVRRGIAYFKENRVTDLGWSEERVWAVVDGSRPGGYVVDLSLDEEGELEVECDCPFDWEPACKHAVAVLLAYGALQPVSEEQEAGAATAAVEARVLRGRSEVEVKHVAGDPWLGTWEARSIDSAVEGRRSWRVELRSVAERINHCDCPDFATNRLGTCKHIEAVRHRLRKRGPRKFERYAVEGPPASVVHLAWDVPDAPRIRLRRSHGGAPAWLEEYFDADGFLLGPPSDAFSRLTRAARGRGGVVIAAEAGAHVRRLEEEAERRDRARALSERIHASGGALPEVAARLYPYQVEGAAFLAAAGRGLLADDMGLGKTVQAIAAAAVLREHEGARRALVVCPASLKHQWVREVGRFTGSEGVVVEGSPASRLALYRRRAAFTMVNYEVLLRDGERIASTLAPDLLILDEAQRIKNWRTKTAAAVKSLDTPFAFVLTGTPLENRLEDLYSLMQVVDPRVLGPLWRYLLDFHVTDDRGKVIGYRNLAQLRQRLEPVMLRRDKSLVRDQLPERIETRLDVSLDRRQRDLNDEAVASAARLGKIAKKRPLTPTEEKVLLAALQQARMACNAAGLVDGETVGSPKLTELASLLEDLCVDSGQKVVVFSQWERMTRMAARVAEGMGLGVVRLHGGVPSSRRGELIDRFREDPAAQVFLSTDAGGVGLNLQAASVLINLDLPWNPAVLEQRIGRVHRLGQREPVRVVLMIARDGFEGRVATLIGAKRELFRNVMTDDASEDVVGVSKKMVELALRTLDDEGDEGEAPDGGAQALVPEAEEAAADEVAPASLTEYADEEGQAPEAAAEGDDSLAPVLVHLQAALGNRIERIVATGGGLVVVLDATDAATEQVVDSCGADVPLAAVDSRSWAALSRLGQGSPVAAERIVYQAPSQPVTRASLAERKLGAARALAEQGHHGEAVSLAAASMIHAVAEAADTTPPPAEHAAVWLYSELLPRGVVRVEQAAAISRALALTQAGEVPAELVTAVLADAGALANELCLAPATG